MRNSDDEPSEPLRVGVENSDDGATLTVKSIKIPTYFKGVEKTDDDGTAGPLTPLFKTSKSDDGRPSVPLTPLCQE